MKIMALRLDFNPDAGDDGCGIERAVSRACIGKQRVTSCIECAAGDVHGDGVVIECEIAGDVNGADGVGGAVGRKREAAPELKVIGPLIDAVPEVALRVSVCDAAMAKLDEMFSVAPVAMVMTGELAIEPLEPMVAAPALMVVLPV